MPSRSKTDDNVRKSNESRFSRFKGGAGAGRNRCINMKRTGILWKRRKEEKELTLVDERGARTYSANQSVLAYLRSSRICDGTFVEVKVRRNVIESLSAVVFEGKVKKFAKKYAFLSTPILPQIKLKADSKRAVAECRIIKNPPKAIANVWFNPTSLLFPVVNNQTVYFSVCITLRRLKRTRNPPYLDVHAVKIKPKDEKTHQGSGRKSVTCSKAETTVHHPVQGDGKNKAEEPENPEDSLRVWMVNRMGETAAKKLGTPQYESKPAPKVSKMIKRSRSTPQLDRAKRSGIQRLTNTHLLITPALQKHRERLAKEKRRDSMKQRMLKNNKTASFPGRIFSRSSVAEMNALRSLTNQRMSRSNTRPLDTRVLPSAPPNPSSIPLLPSAPPGESSRQPFGFSKCSISKFTEDQRQRELDSNCNQMLRSNYDNFDFKSSFSTNDLYQAPFSHDSLNSVRSFGEMSETYGTARDSEATLTSIPGCMSPTLSWIDGGVPLNSPITIAGHETMKLRHNLPSMPDLCRLQQMGSNSNVHCTDFGEEDEGIFRTVSAPRLCTLEENYRAKYHARDLDDGKGLFGDIGMPHYVG